MLAMPAFILIMVYLATYLAAMVLVLVIAVRTMFEIQPVGTVQIP